MKNEILDEVWKAKDAVAQRHGYNVRRLAEAMQKKEKKRGPMLVDLSKNPSR